MRTRSSRNIALAHRLTHSFDGQRVRFDTGCYEQVVWFGFGNHATASSSQKRSGLLAPILYAIFGKARTFIDFDTRPSIPTG